MERTKRKNVFRAELIIFLAVIAVSLLVLWIRWENSHATYKNYDIVVKKNVYCEKTQTGRVDLQIRRKGGKKAKLLQTQQELKQSQSFQIVEDSYKLGIVDDASAYDGNIYEQKNAGGTQYLTLYYVNHETSGRQGKMHLVMNDAKTGKELINIKTSPKVKKDARRYEYRGKDLYVSEEGILLDAGTDEEFYNSQAMTAGLMTVCWKNGKEKQIQFDPNADVSEYEAADIIVPKVTSTGEEKSEGIHCYYALELSDWENIREIKLGENVFAKAENLEKATDDLNKKKKKSKEEKAKEEAEFEKEMGTEGKVPGFYAFLPIIPLIIILMFSPLTGSSIKVDVVEAMFMSIGLSMLIEGIRRKAFKSTLAELKIVFTAMGSQFANVITLIVAGEFFALGLTRIGVISALIDSTKSAGLGPQPMILVMTAIIAISSILMGSGNAPFFAFAALAPAVAASVDLNPIVMLMPMQLAAGIARSISPITAVIVAVAGISGVSPFDVVKRTAAPISLI